MDNVQKLRTWRQALTQYRSSLKSKDYDRLTDMKNVEDLIDHLVASKAAALDRGKHRKRPSAIKKGLKRSSSLLAIIGSAIPELSTILWGAVFIFNVRMRRQGPTKISPMVIGHIMPVIGEFCTLISSLGTYEDLKHVGVASSLRRYYDHMISYFKEALKYLERCSIWLFRVIPCPEPLVLQDISNELKKDKIALESQASRATFEKNAREILSLRPQSRPEAILPCKVVPYPENKRFFGREDILKRIEANLAASRPGQASFALYGLGGVGKTQIALKYVYDHYDEFQVVFWMHADSRAKLLQAYLDAAKQLLGEPRDSQEDPESSVAALRSWLSQAAEDWLIVFDNVEDSNLLKPFWPPGNHGTVIMTSRDPAFANFANGGLPIEPFLPRESEDFLLSLIAPDPDARALIDRNLTTEAVKLLEYLPLAINQVAHFVLERGCTLQDFLDIYKSLHKTTHIFSKFDTSAANLFYEHSLATVWQISIKSLSGDATKLLAILVFFDPDKIPDTLLRNGAQGIPSLNFLSNIAQYGEAKGELIKRGLISWRDSSISMHRLVQETVFHQPNSEMQKEAFQQAITVLQRMFPTSSESVFKMNNIWAECEKYLPHVLALEGRYHDSTCLKQHQELAELLFRAAWYLHERRLPESAFRLLRTALKICKSPEVNDLIRTRILGTLAAVALDSGEIAEAEDYVLQVVQIREETLSHDDVQLARAYSDHAVVLAAKGKYSKSIRIYEKALAIIERCHDKDKSELLFHTRNNMARAYERMGDAKKALELHFSLGGELGNGLRKEGSEGAALSFYAIGNAYLALGSPKGAEYHMKALKIRKDLVGQQYFTAVSLHKMGDILRRKCSLEEADNAFKQASDIFEKEFKAEAELARTWYHWSLLKSELGDHAEADRLRDSAWNIRHERTGEVQKDEGSSTDGFDKLVLYVHS